MIYNMDNFLGETTIITSECEIIHNRIGHCYGFKNMVALRDLIIKIGF